MGGRIAQPICGIGREKVRLSVHRVARGQERFAGTGSIDGETCARGVVEAFVARLDALECDAETLRQRRAWAATVIRDAVIALRGGESATCLRVGVDESVWFEGRASSDPRFVLRDADLLVPIALRGLLAVFPDDPVAVASILMRRLLDDAASALEAIAGHLPVAEVADREVLQSMLTTREIEVFELILEGVPIKQISTRLCISSRTARNHMTNIGRKFSVTGRAAVIRRAREVGALVAVPLALASAAATDVAASIGGLL